MGGGEGGVNGGEDGWVGVGYLEVRSRTAAGKKLLLCLVVLVMINRSLETLDVAMAFWILLVIIISIDYHQYWFGILTCGVQYLIVTNHVK